MTIVRGSFLTYLKSSDDLNEHDTEDEYIRYTDNYVSDMRDYFIPVNIVPINCNRYDFRNLQITSNKMTNKFIQNNTFTLETFFCRHSI